MLCVRSRGDNIRGVPSGNALGCFAGAVKVVLICARVALGGGLLRPSPDIK